MRIYRLEIQNMTYNVVSNNSESIVRGFKSAIEVMILQFIQYNLKDCKFNYTENLPTIVIARTNCGEMTIEFNIAYLYLLSWDLIKHVLLHEIAHALSPNDTYHGKEWEYQCELLGIPSTAKIRVFFEPNGDGTHKVSFSKYDIEKTDSGWL
jgi:hypothetical protein